VRHHSATHQKYSAHVDLHHVVEEVWLRFDNITDARDAGIVEEHVDALKSFDCSLREGDRLVLIGDVDSIAATVLLAAASSMSATSTRAPSLANSLALASPMPEPAPVIRQTLPSSLPI
jgi:hypothetical protein